MPQAILDLQVIAHLVDAGYVVVACGGGGIPVIENEQGEYRGVMNRVGWFFTQLDVLFALNHKTPHSVHTLTAA